MKCKAKSEQLERIMDLSVEIQGDIGTLEQALKQFTTTEVLDGGNRYRCDRFVLFDVFASITWFCMVCLLQASLKGVFGSGSFTQ